MIASLWAATTKFVRNSGLATDSHMARRGLTPCNRARRGMTHMHAITDTTHKTRNSSTEASGSAPVTRTTSCSSHRNTGPYGGGDSAHNWSAPSWKKLSIVETPDSYGFNPFAITRPCPMYEYTSRLNNGMLTSMGAAHAAIEINTQRALSGPHGLSFWPRRSHCRTRSIAPRASITTETTTPTVSKRIHMISGMRRSEDTLASHPTPREPNSNMSEPTEPIATVRVNDAEDVASRPGAASRPVPGSVG